MSRPAAEIFTVYGRVIIALLACGGVAAVYYWLSRRRLGTGYGVLWLGIFGALLAVAVFPITAVWVGRIAGSREPEGGLRLGAFLVAFVLLLYMSLKTSQLQRRIEELVQTLALREAARKPRPELDAAGAVPPLTPPPDPPSASGS